MAQLRHCGSPRLTGAWSQFGEVYVSALRGGDSDLTSAWQLAGSVWQYWCAANDGLREQRGVGKLAGYLRCCSESCKAEHFLAESLSRCSRSWRKCGLLLQATCGAGLPWTFAQPEKCKLRHDAFRLMQFAANAAEASSGRRRFELSGPARRRCTPRNARTWVLEVFLLHDSGPAGGCSFAVEFQR